MFTYTNKWTYLCSFSLLLFWFHFLFLFQTPPLVCKIFEKDLLSDILDYLDLPPANYSIDVTENDLFTGSCSLYVGSCYGSTDSGPTNIQCEPKLSPFDAESSAAAEAIRFLERSQNFEVVDFNYDTLVLLRQKYDNLLQIRLNYDAVLSDASRAWSDFAKSLQSFIDDQYDISLGVFWSTEQSSDYAALISCASEMEQALYQIWNKQHSAISDINSSVPWNHLSVKRLLRLDRSIALWCNLMECN